MLQKLSAAINNSVNRSIGIEPNRVNFKNRKAIFEKLYGNRAPKLKCRFSIGDVVRIALKKNIFSKGYTHNWSEELYKIHKVNNDANVCYYVLRSVNGHILDKKFYDEEVSLVVRHEVSNAS